MKKMMLTFLLLATANLSQAAIVLNSGDTYTTAFSLQSDGDYFKLTDNYWEVIVELIDSDNLPFSTPIAPSTITLDLYEDPGATSQVFSMTEDTSMWFSDYGILFAGFEGLFADHDGSLRITYNGPGSATLSGVIVSNFAGTLAPSNVATTRILPEALAPVPLPAAVWLFLSGAALLGMIRRRR